MHQDKLISDIVKKEMLKITKPEQIYDNEVSMAAGDIGDLSCFKPTIQFGYGGFKGNCHGKDLCINDYNKAYLNTSIVIYNSVQYLLNHPEYVNKIKNEFKPTLTKKEYLAYLK